MIFFEVSEKQNRSGELYCEPCLTLPLAWRLLAPDLWGKVDRSVSKRIPGLSLEKKKWIFIEGFLGARPSANLGLLLFSFYR